MKLLWEIDNVEAHRYTDSGRVPYHLITWEHRGAFYPAKHWRDFGPLVIGWWILAARNLLHGSDDAVFTFMDGPYEIEVSKLPGDAVELRFRNRPDQLWHVTLEEFLGALLNGADGICRRLELDDLWVEGRTQLVALITEFKREIEKRRTSMGSDSIDSDLRSG